MNQLKTLPSVFLVLLLTSCATIQPGNDPVVVNAERVTLLAADTFDLVEKTEFQTYATLKAVDPAVAAKTRTYVNYLRKNDQDWLESARNLTKAYKYNRSSENKVKLETAIAVLLSAIDEANKYIALMSTTHAWLSFNLAEQINQE